jgi:hypothetical protein
MLVLVMLVGLGIALPYWHMLGMPPNAGLMLNEALSEQMGRCLNLVVE